MTEKLVLPQVHLSGSPRQMGQSHGEQLREKIRAFSEERLRAFAEYAAERGGASLADFIATGARCLQVVERFHPEGYAEHCGIAEAAGIDKDQLYATANLTDVRDVLLLPAPSADPEGCTAVLVPALSAAQHTQIVGQSWDLNPGDLDYVVALHRQPSSGLETWSVSCAGALSLIGMNETGLMVGTTNIKTKRSKVGVCYLHLLHRALCSATLSEALSQISAAPRAAAHTYWLADGTRALELECDPAEVIERRLAERPLVRTNHCLADSFKVSEGETPSASSVARRARAETLLAAGNVDRDALIALFSDRADGIFSINRYPEDGESTATNACLIGVPTRRELWACRGPADRGEWVQLQFGN